MLSSLRRKLRAGADTPPPAVPAGARVYAIGDVHGRRDLFDALIAGIDADDAARGPADTTIVLLGDLVDRGPDSAGVVAAARTLAARRPTRLLIGNHEEMLEGGFASLEALREWLRNGGRETLLSYGMRADDYRTASFKEVQAAMLRLIPAADRAFLAAGEDRVAIGDYLFVHAGVRPGVALDAQRVEHLRWIREPFLSHFGDHGAFVVHGHTIHEEPQLRANRIGIDTGAYYTGRLTALALEGTARWLIGADDSGGSGAIRVAVSAIGSPT